ncbi:MAG: outer membrane beta-barrel protein [Candidatus Rokubacteria bacterium]|nr:outer membrane beta-barrel protein [Candidatus Rokubacteria bacterium]
MTVWRAIGVIVLAVVLSPLPAAAIDLNQWVPGLKTTVFVSERAEYETNIFQVNSGAQDDVIFRTIPGFLATYERGPVLGSLGYRLEFLNFLELTRQDEVHHLGAINLGTKFTRLRTNLLGSLAITSDPATTELTGRTNSTTITAAPAVDYLLTSRLGVGANYGYTYVRFENRAAALDRDSHLFGGSAFWNFLPKAELRVGYGYGFSEFVREGSRRRQLPDRDFDRHHVYGSVSGDLTPKLSSTFRVGYEVRDYHREPVSDEGSFIVGGDWTYRATDRTRISLITSKGFEESIFGQTGQTVLFETTSAVLLAEQQIGSKIRANARISGVLNDYPRKDITVRQQQPKFREDVILGWGAGIDYDIQRWLSVGAEYSHTRRDSTFDEFSYKDDKFTAKVTLQF